MTGTPFSLNRLGMVLIVIAMALGGWATWLWTSSAAAWDAHLARAELTGSALYGAIATGAPLPKGVSMAPLDPQDQATANIGAFDRISSAPRPAYVTNMSILSTQGPARTSPALQLAVVSNQLRYPLSQVTGTLNTPAQTLGALTRVMASYCSDPVLYARFGEGPWQMVLGEPVWGCAAAPADHRLVGGLLALVGFGALVTALLNATAPFAHFANALRSRAKLGGPDSYDTQGPQELHDIVAAVNSHLEAERAQLANRALVLSGVSHDLGTPATRLRLRAGLIEDTDLRHRFEADIDQLTGIIESVLTYTRAEIRSEDAREISLAALVEAVVADFSDLGRPVTLESDPAETVAGGRSVFMSKQGHGQMPEERRVLVVGRPVSLQRALNNLIDNALKYGRHARVSLKADATFATITIEDEGTSTSPQDLERLISPYQRGSNARTIQGFGLGLTIVQSIANMHAGDLSFTRGPHGLRAHLRIRRH